MAQIKIPGPGTSICRDGGQQIKKIKKKKKTVIRDKGLHNNQVLNPRKSYNNCIYAPNIGAPQHVKQMLTAIKGEIESNTIIGGTLTPLTAIDRSSRQKINRKHRP